MTVSTTGDVVVAQEHQADLESASTYIHMRPADCADCLADNGFRRCTECKRLFAPSVTSLATCYRCTVAMLDPNYGIEGAVVTFDLPAAPPETRARINREVRAFARAHGYTTQLRGGQRYVRLIGKGLVTKTSLYTWSAVTPRSKRGRPGKPAKSGLKVEMTSKAIRVTGSEAAMARFLARRLEGFCPRLANPTGTPRKPTPNGPFFDAGEGGSVGSPVSPEPASWAPEGLAKGLAEA